jgi:hypothetical protein
MNTIFISPLLWKRFNRAVRRREEGQALVLIAAAAVAMVAIVGLSIDGGMLYWEAQKLQRAADSAALAGVVWVPSQPLVADARGRLSVQSQGFNSFFQSGNQQASYNNDQVMAGNVGQYTSYVGQIPNPYSYTVILGHKSRRYFLGVLGFGDIFIERRSTAEYATPARLGGSFNYFGSTSLKYDWVIRDQAAQGDEYYKTLWKRYITNRCDQPNRPDPCVGTFWLNTQGPDTNHASGDAYTPVGDGANAPSNNNNVPYTGSVIVNGGVGYSPGNSCLRQNDYTSWALTQSWWFTLPAACNTAANNPNVVNKDLHPDGDASRGFGYSIAVQLDKNALHPYTGNPSDPYTSFRVSIYDAAQSDVGGQEQFGTGDNYWGTSSTYGSRPYNGIDGTGDDNTRKQNFNNRNDDKTFNCITGGGLPDVASNGQSRRENGQIITGGTVTDASRYCQNGMRTRFSLYYPPLADGTPTIWRTRGSLIAAFDATELVAQNEHWTNSGADNSHRCYFADTAYPNNTDTQSPDRRVIFACPAGTGGGTVSDMYWNAYPNPSDPAYTARIQSLNAAGVNSYNNGTQSNNVDPSMSCRSVVDSSLYSSTTEYNNALNLTGSVVPPYMGRRIPYNMRGYDPVWSGPGVVYSPRGGVNYTGGYQSYKGWRCAWDFDSSNTLNPGANGNTATPGKVNTVRQQAEGITNQPYLYISDYGYINGGSSLQRIKYVDGQRLPGVAADPQNVRGGVYLLQAQVFGGGGTNRYAVKAEYDNAKQIPAQFIDPATGNTITVQITPVPQVYGISAMNIYVNAINNQAGSLNVIFDLAYIPPQNADSLATLELFDAGDVGTDDLNIQILEPTGYGQKLKADGSVPVGTPIPARGFACPMQYAGSPAVPCAYGSTTNSSTVVRINNNTYFNDQWLFMVFRIPNTTSYENWATTCNIQQVPDFLCFYYQVNYQMNDSAADGSASDTTTWQLNIRSQPVRLIQ